jgi:hypothetical protein
MYKGIVVFFLGWLLLSACKDKYEPAFYYSAAEQDSLMTDMITFIYNRPANANEQTRFESGFRKYYVNHIKDFQFENYYINAAGVHYFYLIRPARSPKGNIRGVGGSFKLDQNGKILSFKEIFNTPIAAREELNVKGNELFKWMTVHGNVNDYLKNPDYIEWPDKMTYYDTIQYEWLIKPGY